jgi:hypothetical protein
MPIELEMVLRLRLAAALGAAIPSPSYSLTVKPRSKRLTGNLSLIMPKRGNYDDLS